MLDSRSPCQFENLDLVHKRSETEGEKEYRMSEVDKELNSGCFRMGGFWIVCVL